jgi:hypothetical protein
MFGSASFEYQLGYRPSWLRFSPGSPGDFQGSTFKYETESSFLAFCRSPYVTGASSHSKQYLLLIERRYIRYEWFSSNGNVGECRPRRRQYWLRSVVLFLSSPSRITEQNPTRQPLPPHLLHFTVYNHPLIPLCSPYIVLLPSHTFVTELSGLSLWKLKAKNAESCLCLMLC